MFGVLINVGSGCCDPNGRGLVFPDLTFEYLPIPEGWWSQEKGEERRWVSETLRRVPSYRDLGFKRVKFPDIPVHLDPEFDTFTYGHVRRGFGDLKRLLQLGKNTILFFYANLQKGLDWAPYIIGYFSDPVVYDCRKMSNSDMLELGADGFANNAHLKRKCPYATLLIKGNKNSRLLEKAFPITGENRLMLKKSMRRILFTPSGKTIPPGAPWFRWTIICRDSEELMAALLRAQVHENTPDLP